MNIEDYLKMIKFIDQNNSWKNTLYRPDMDFSKPLIKYIRHSIDTRDMKIFMITFDKKQFRFYENMQEIDDFKEEIYKYLNDKNYKSKYMTIIEKD